MYSSGKYKIYLGGYKVKGAEINDYCIECDRYSKVMGKIVTELYMDDDKSVIKSMIIPINNIVKIMDGDIECI